MENASVVDSSLTDCKDDVENWDDPGNSSHKVNDKCYSAGAEKQAYSSEGEGSLCATTSNKLYPTRYFIIKSLNHQNIQLSIEKGIWATQVMNEPILEEAFHNSGKVVLIFSVNMSGFFQGYAQMMSPVGRRENVWSQASGGSSPWGRSFRVKWLRLHNLPFQKTLHLKNPLNDYKPVKISRDCQELSQDVGEALCRLLDEDINVDAKLKRSNFCIDGILKKNSCEESTGPLEDEDYFHNVLPFHMAWAKTPIFDPSLLQNLTHNEANVIHLAHKRLPGRFVSQNLPTTSKASKSTRMKRSHACGSYNDVNESRDICFQSDGGHMSRERSHITCSLSEDDFLEMSYEEYLEVCHRFKKRTLAAESSSLMQEPLNKDRGNDPYWQYLDNWYHPQKAYHQSLK